MLMSSRLNPRKSLPVPETSSLATFRSLTMKGFLHLGHAFSFSKLEFAAAYHRLRSANVLFAFPFHCTGMHIKASADKLAREMQTFGNPPVFPCEGIEVLEGATERCKRKLKSKAASKSGGQVY